MRSRPEKYRYKAKPDLSIDTVKIFPAIIRGNKAYAIDPIYGKKHHPWLQGPAYLPTGAWISQASRPDAKMALIAYGPLHKKSTNPRHFLLEYKSKGVAWYIRKRCYREGYAEWTISKEISYSKLRKDLVSKVVEIFDEWFGKQFD